jgi:very-short-patch-repair endonuclease
VIDGGQHDSRQRSYDQKRDHFIEGLQFTVFRFWNTETLANIEGVVMIIEQTIKKNEAHHPPSMKGGLECAVALNHY